MRDYRKYDVWKIAHEYTLFAYKNIIDTFPSHEKYDLASQFKRATYSIPLNIVEGCGRNSDKDFVHFLDIALGSCNESEYCSLLAKDLGYLNDALYNETFSFTNEIKSKLINLIKKIRCGD